VSSTLVASLVLARSVDAERFIGTTVATPPADVASAAPTISVESDGVERISALASVRRGPWVLSVAIPRSSSRVTRCSPSGGGT
jgi:hypothetical protein